MRLKRLGLYVSGCLGLALVVACSAGEEESTGEGADAISLADASKVRFDPNHPSFAADQWLARLQEARKTRGDKGVTDVLEDYVAFAATKPAPFVAKMTEYASILEPARAQLALAGLHHKALRFGQAVQYYAAVDKAGGTTGASRVSLAIAIAEAGAEIELGQGVLVEDMGKREKMIGALIASEATLQSESDAHRLTYNIVLGETASRIVDLPRARLLLGDVKMTKDAASDADKAFAGTKLFLAKKQFGLAGMTDEVENLQVRIEKFDNVFGTDFLGKKGGSTLSDDDE